MKTLALACLAIMAVSIPAEAQSTLQQRRRLNPTMTAQKYMRYYQPTDAELIAEETRRLREEMERYRQMEEQRMRMEQQMEFYRQQRAAQQRAIQSGNQYSRRR